MSELFHELGINVPALVAQAANFLIVLVVLTVYVYRPLSKMMEERSKKIAFGIQGAEQAERRLVEIAETAKERKAQSEREALLVMQEAKREGEVAARRIVGEGEAKGAALVEEAHARALRVKAEEMARVEREAREFVRAVLEKTVQIDPKLIDERLIDQAAALIKKTGSA